MINNKSIDLNGIELALRTQTTLNEHGCVFIQTRSSIIKPLANESIFN